MKVMKFGGTSVGSPQRIKDVATLVAPRGRNIIVLSAMAGTTNSLVEICDNLEAGNRIGAQHVLDKLREKYSSVVAELYSKPQFIETANSAVAAHMAEIQTVINEDSPSEELIRLIVAQGELISTALMDAFMHEIGVQSVLLSALDFIKKDEQGQPDIDAIGQALELKLESNPQAELFITQGFICRNAAGEVDNLERGGSDYTATIIGAAINAEEIEIWTDIDGLHNNDPRYVENTWPVRHLSYREAADLAYFGAKILHPLCVLPAEAKDVPVRLLNTMQPTAPGTIIDGKSSVNGIKAISAKDGVNIIRFSPRKNINISTNEFKTRIFDAINHAQIPQLLSETSGGSIVVATESLAGIVALEESISEYSEIQIEKDMTLVCIAGSLAGIQGERVGEVFSAVGSAHISLIVFGTDMCSLIMAIATSQKIPVLRSLSDICIK